MRGISAEAGGLFHEERTVCARALRQETWCVRGTDREKPGVAGPQVREQVLGHGAGEKRRDLIIPHGPCLQFCACPMQLGACEGSYGG